MNSSLLKTQYNGLITIASSEIIIQMLEKKLSIIKLNTPIIHKEELPVYREIITEISLNSKTVTIDTSEYNNNEPYELDILQLNIENLIAILEAIETNSYTVLEAIETISE